MPGTFRYSASLDKAYRDEETGLIRSTIDLNNQNGEHKRTCSMDSLDSISSSGGSMTSSSCNSSSSTHSRQVSADSTSSPTPTNFTSPTSYINNKLPLANSVKASYNPHQFVKATPSALQKCVSKNASDQMKQVKEVVKTFRSPVKEDEEEWQNNLSNWKSKRRVRSETTFQRVDEMKQLEEENDSAEPKRKNKTFSQMCQDKARRVSGYNLSIYPDLLKESTDIYSEKQKINDDNPSENNIGKNKDHDSSFDENSSDHDNCNKDKDDGYSSKDECNKTETDDQSDTAANEDSISMITESSALSEPEILPAPAYTISSVEAFQETARDADCSSTTSTSATNSSEDDFPSTAFHESDYVTDDLMDETQSTICMNGSELSHEPLLPSDSELEKSTQLKNEISTLTLSLNPSSEAKDFGFTIKGGKDYSSNVLVESITSKGAAEKAGVLVGNVIKTINGEETCNRTHRALVFAIKQASYTGQLHLGVARTSAPEVLVFENEIQSLPKPKSAKTFQEKRAIFLQNKEGSTSVERVSPSRDSVSRRKSMFDSLASQEAAKKAIKVDVRLSLRDRVASFESIDNSALQKHTGHGSLNNINRTPPIVKPKGALSQKVSNTEPVMEILDKEFVLSKYDLVETNVDTKSDSDEQHSDSDAKQEFTEETIVKESVIRDCHTAFEDSYLIPVSDNSMESLREVDQYDNISFTQDIEHKSESPHQTTTVHSSSEPASNEPEVHEKYQRNFVEIPAENILEQLCHTLSKDLNIAEVKTDISRSKSDEMSKSSENFQIMSNDLQVCSSVSENYSDNECIEDVSDALEEALALIDDSTPGDTEKKINDSTSKANGNAPMDLGLNIIYDSASVPKYAETDSNFEDLFGISACSLNNFGRPRSIAEPPKEKPPPPPVETDISHQNIPPMKRLNSTKRIKKEILRRRSDFLGLGGQADDTIDIDELVPKPPPQIDDLLRSELEMGKSLLSSSLSSDHSELSNESPYESNFEPSDMSEKFESDELKMQQEEEKHIRELEEQRIQMQEARRKAEEERLLQERVVQMRTQQEMLMIEKERLKREQNEVIKARSSSESSISSATNVKGYPPTNVIPIYNRSKNRPRAPPPPPPKPSARPEPLSPQERGRSEVIRLSKRPTSGDFSGVNLNSSFGFGQPIQKQPLSRHSLQSLSAVPKANLSNSDSHWMKREPTVAKRRSDVLRKDTYSHWLIQEAEMRRIAEHSERKRADKQSVNRNDFNSPLTYSKSESNIASGENKNNNNKFIPDSVVDTLASRVNNRNNSNQTLDKTPPSSHDWSPQYQITRSKSTEMNNSNYGSSPEQVSPTSSNYAHHVTADKMHISPPMHAYYHNLSPTSVNCDFKSSSTYADLNANSVQTSRLQHPYHDISSKQTSNKAQDNMLSVSGRKKCSNCLEELGRGAAMIIESLKLFYHIKCFRCSVCQVQLGNGSCGADVRVRNNKLHCQNCYSNDEAGLKFSKV